MEVKKFTKYESINIRISILEKRRFNFTTAEIEAINRNLEHEIQKGLIDNELTLEEGVILTIELFNVINDLREI